MDRAELAGTRLLSPRTKVPPSTDMPLYSWVRRRIGSTVHEERVLQIADAFFDLTRDLHQLDRRARWALSAACLAHDVGRSVDPEDHARIGAEMVLSEPGLHLSSADRRALAYLTLYHRGPVPELGTDEILRASDDRATLLKVLGILRAADTLDSRSIEPPRLLLMRRDDTLTVSCFLRESSERADKAFCRPKKYRLMEQTLGCTIRVNVQLGDTRMLHV